jgi:enoyl-CoA hydratase/carnithine racemase
VFPNFAASRRFAQKMNELRAAEIAADPGRTARAGDLNAMGLIDEVLHRVIELYREQRNPELLTATLDALSAELGADSVERTLEAFAERFPTVAAYRGELTPQDYLAGATDGRSNREIALESCCSTGWPTRTRPTAVTTSCSTTRRSRSRRPTASYSPG